MKESEFKINHPLGFTISKELKVIEITSVSKFKKDDIGNGYVWYDLPKTEIFGKKLTFRVCFYNGTLDSFSFAVDAPEIYGNSWDDWSKEKEILRANHTREWIEKNGYKVGKFKWGEIWTGYNSKDGSGGGNVRFKP